MRMNQLTLKKRIFGGFGVLLLCMVIVMIMCYTANMAVASKTVQAKKETAGTQIQQQLDDILTETSSLQTTIYTGTLVILSAGLFLAFFLARSIIISIQTVIDELDAGSDQVSVIANQITQSNQSLAVAASEQASSIEETSSSLEEMASMTKRNADDSQQADDLMQEANKVIATANNTMDDMTISMQHITQTSEDTQKIVKTIDEIAFQTNLLALNAAVEAARAGEAGAGFAVVADEVRNLAIRAAEAAKNTSEMIEGSVRQIKEGSVQLDTTNKAFDEVAIMAEKVTHLIGEIAAASGQQANGIEQINTAIGEMDHRVQNNAAASEENASASEEMSSHAIRMKSVIAELSTLTGSVQTGNQQIRSNHGILKESLKALSFRRMIN